MSVRVFVEDALLQKEIEGCLKGTGSEFVKSEADLVFASEGWIRKMLPELKNSERRTSIIVTVKEGQELPSVFLENIADDILVLPLRRNELLSRLRWHYNLQHLREIESTSSGIPALVKKLEEDLQLAEKVQRRLIREKFPPIQGLSIKSKYLCGMQSGGDYFDVVELPNHVIFLLADSSSYSLSSSLLASLMHQSLALRVSGGELEPAALFSPILAELEIKEKDKLSLFLGVLDRRTFKMRYLQAGAIWLGIKSFEEAEERWICEPGERAFITPSQRVLSISDECGLKAQDRLVLMSDGWPQIVGQSWRSSIKKVFGGADGQDALNAWGFHLRSAMIEHQDDEDSLPEQDCSLLLVDVDKKILRLT